MDTARSKPQLDALTSIRFFAAFHVVVYHSARSLAPSLPENAELLHHVMHTGYTGVNLFYILSGFILAYTYLDPERPPSVGGRKFWIARFARIYPVYALSLLLAAPLVIHHFLTTNSLFVALGKITVTGGVAGSLMQAWIPPLRAVWNPPAWSLSAEVFFYLAFPFLAVRIWRLSRRGARWCALFCWGLGLLPALAGFVLAPESAAVRAVDNFGDDHLVTFLRSAPILRLPEFAFGIALARAFFPSHEERERWGSRRAEVSAWLALVGLAIALSIADLIPRLLVHSGILDPLYGLLIVSLAISRGPLARLLSLRPLVVLGQASYAIYVLHIPLKHWLIAALPPEYASLGPALFAGYALLVIVVSIAVYYGFEDPARRWIRGRFANREARADAGSGSAGDAGRRA